MRSWRRILLGSLLIGAVAVAGIALNFTLLRLTQDAHDPVGKLSPRAVFADSHAATTPTTPATTTAATTPTTRGDDGASNGGHARHDGDD